MSPKMFIPMMVTFTEREYRIVQGLMKELCVDDKQFSSTVRLIIREWNNLKENTGSKNGADTRNEEDDLSIEDPGH